MFDLIGFDELEAEALEGLVDGLGFRWRFVIVSSFGYTHQRQSQNFLRICGCTLTDNDFRRCRILVQFLSVHKIHRGRSKILNLKFIVCPGKSRNNILKGFDKLESLLKELIIFVNGVLSTGCISRHINKIYYSKVPVKRRVLLI